VNRQGTIEDVLAGRADWALECRDGFALARELADGAVDHVIGDPPYDEQTHAGARTLKWDDDRRTGGKVEHSGNAIDIDFAALPPIDSFLPALIRCSKRWTLLFCTGAMLGDYKREAGGTRDSGGAWIRDGYWWRTNSAPQITGDRPAAACEAIAILHKQGGKMRWNRGGNQAIWRGVICKDPRRMHPTKKPAWLMEALIRDFTDPGELIFDPTAGEGSTLEACVKLGRRCIGCEIDPKYHAAGVARIDRAARGLKQIDLLAV
jgi:site-specific DNA-methyltransferase (adenine-specific)